MFTVPVDDLFLQKRWDGQNSAMMTQHFIPRSWLPTAFAVLLCLASISAVHAETWGDFNYSSANGEATITSYTGSGGAVVIPSLVNGLPVTSISVAAFSPNFDGMASLTSVTIPDGVTRIERNVFTNCKNLTSVAIPSSVTSIGDAAFAYCTSLTSVVIPNGVSKITNSLFLNCTALVSVTVPNSVTSIEYAAFMNCASLASVVIPSGVTSIPANLFYNCTSLASVVIPDSVTSIEDGAFSGCTGLAIVTAPVAFYSSLGRIGINAPVASKAMLDGIANNLSTNTTFINALAGNDAFVTAVANKIKSTSGNYGIATQNALSSALTESRADGINSVLSNPSLWTLYTTSQIQNMAVGDLVLTKNVQGNFMLNYDIEQSTDLQTWTPYQALSLPLAGLPTDKAFVRIKVKP
jgi:hypothetical protein